MKVTLIKPTGSHTKEESRSRTGYTDEFLPEMGGKRKEELRRPQIIVHNHGTAQELKIG